MTLIDLPTVPKEWDDMDRREQADHRDECPDLCAACESKRMFGICPSCGPDSEGDAEERCLACGWQLVLDSDPADQASWWLEAG